MPRWLQRIVLILAAAGVALLLGELILRGINYHPNVLTPPYLFADHESRWFTLRPGFSESMDTPAGNISYIISDKGVRTSRTGFSSSTDTDTSTVYLIGDSFAFGWGVNYEHTYAHLLDSAWQETTVVNLGVPSYGIAQSVDRLKEYADRHGLPDMVLYLFHPNDPVDNLTGEKEVVNGIRINADRSHKQLLSYIAHIYHNSRVAALVIDAYVGQSMNPRVDKRAELQQSSMAIREREDAQSALQSLQTLVSWCAQQNVELQVAEITDSQYSDLLGAYLQDKGIPFYRLGRCFEELKGEVRYQIFDGHWNDVGHRLVYECLRDSI